MQSGVSNTADLKIKITLHLIAWIIVISIPLYLSNAFGDNNMQRVYEFYLHTLSAIIIFYLGYLWLVPQFFLKEKRVAYIVMLVTLILLTYFITDFIKDHFLFDPIQDAKFREAFSKLIGGDQNAHPPFKAFGFFNHLIASFLISGFAIGLGVMERLKQNEKKQKEMEKEKLDSELTFLKNQVSPHFFFNTLNNIYSLIGIDGPTAQDSVLKLSKLMRYLLYESEHGETLMNHEIEFINNYIDLMRLRLSPKVELKIDFPKDFADFSIPPLLFIPFIENAFKHGISYNKQSFIHIRMAIQNEEIRFISENSIGSSNGGAMQHSGIGLENVRKRLSLLFPGKHLLKIEESENLFKVELSIQKIKYTL